MNKFGEIIRRRREEKELLLRHVAAQLDIDTALISKVERGDRNLKRDHVVLISEILDIDTNELLTLWLADRVCQVIEDEENAIKAIKIDEEGLNEYKKRN